MKEIAKMVLQKKDLIERLPTLKEFDGGFAIKGLCRIRYNFLRYDGKIGIIMSIIYDAHNNTRSGILSSLPRATSMLSTGKSKAHGNMKHLHKEWT